MYLKEALKNGGKWSKWLKINPYQEKQKLLLVTQVLLSTMPWYTFVNMLHTKVLFMVNQKLHLHKD
jgi:hypothetical protein